MEEASRKISIEALSEKISMGREKRIPVQVNLLPPVIKLIDRIRRETGVSKARIVEYFVRVGMDATGFAPKGHRSTQQSAKFDANTKSDIKAFLKELSPEGLEEFAELLKDVADSRRFTKIANN